MRRLMTLLAIAGLAAAPAAFAEVPAADRLPITDPETLVLLGYPPETTGVALWRHAAPAFAAAAGGATPEGVTGGLDYAVSSGFEFFPLSDVTTYAKGPSFLVYNGAVVSLTNGGVFETQFALAEAVYLRWVDVLGHHDHGSEPLTLSVLERCLPFLSGGNPSETVLAATTVNDSDGGFVRMANMARLPVDNQLCTYHLRAVFGDGTGTAPGILIQLVKARAEFLGRLIFADGFESGNTSAW